MQSPFLRAFWDPVSFQILLHRALCSWPQMELQPDVDHSKQQDRYRGKRARGKDLKSGAYTWPESCPPAAPTYKEGWEMLFFFGTATSDKHCSTVNAVNKGLESVGKRQTPWPKLTSGNHDDHIGILGRASAITMYPFIHLVDNNETVTVVDTSAMPGGKYCGAGKRGCS